MLSVRERNRGRLACQPTKREGAASEPWPDGWTPAQPTIESLDDWRAMALSLGIVNLISIFILVLSSAGDILAATRLPQEAKTTGNKEDQPVDQRRASLRGHCRNAR